MKKKQRRPRVARAKDKSSIEAREMRAAILAESSPNSLIVQTIVVVKDALSVVILAGIALRAARIKAEATAAAAATAKSDLDNQVVVFDTSYDFAASAVEAHCVTPADIQAIGLDVVIPVTNPFVPPKGMKVWIDSNGVVRADVEPAPGIPTYNIFMSTDPSNPEGWTLVKGHGANRKLENLPAGDRWFKAQSVSADDVSAFTVPVMVKVPAK